MSPRSAILSLAVAASAALGVLAPQAAFAQQRSSFNLPAPPRCFAFPVDKEEFVQELQRLRRQAMTNLPLGAEKGDPEFDRALAQSRLDVQAIDQAIQQAERTPYCPPFGPKAGAGAAPSGGTERPGSMPSAPRRRFGPYFDPR